MFVFLFVSRPPSTAHAIRISIKTDNGLPFEEGLLVYVFGHIGMLLVKARVWRDGSYSVNFIRESTTPITSGYNHWPQSSALALNAPLYWQCVTFHYNYINLFAKTCNI